jgi:hypothetical protein
MKVPSAAELLALWERGGVRHPIDRTLLLAGWAAPELPPERLGDLPLGAVNRALLQLRETWFGSNICAYVDCGCCGERLELALDVGRLVPAAARDDGELQLAGYRFRLPCSRDLAAVAQERDAETAALDLIERCCVERPAEPPPGEIPILLAAIEEGLEALDPALEISLSLACEACGHHWVAVFDVGALLWDEIDAGARALLAKVDALARAYGWTEPEILALSAQRRAAYLAMVAA